MKLTKGTTLQIRGADGTEIRCDGGQLWLTEAGDPNDYFLEGRESHRVRTHGVVVIEALSDAHVEIHRLPPKHPLWIGGIVKTSAEPT